MFRFNAQLTGGPVELLQDPLGLPHVAHDQAPRHPHRAGAELQPREPGRVAIYACGPTVYGRIHVGNARPFVVFSLLKRFLAAHQGFDVTFVANITDINDKIYAAANAAGTGSERLAHDMADA